MTAYLDTNALIAYLYEESDNREKADQAKQLFDAIVARKLSALITFYALPELYAFVVRNYPEDKRNDTFRESLVELFSAPLIVKPFVDRTELERLRRQFTITDSGDVYHVAAALHYDCSALITFDYHFRQVASLIPVYAPEEFLATLENAD